MTGLEVLHRGTNGAIPYLAHNLFAERLPIVRVKTGPLCENVDQTETLLKQHGFDVPIERSAVPIRTAASIQA
jgi:hypothetical protein